MVGDKADDMCQIFNSRSRIQRT